MMQVQINGEALELESGVTVAALVDKLELDLDKIAIECNREIVSRSAYADITLADGDALEIVGFVGGG